MKSFFTACAILLTICALIAFNTFYVTRKTGELERLCAEISETENPERLVERLRVVWDDSKTPLTLSVKHAEADRAESALLRLTCYLENGRRAEFLAELAVFRSVLSDISSSQKFSLDNIF